MTRGLLAVVLMALLSMPVLADAQRPAPSDTLKPYVEQLKSNPSDDALRTKIIKMAAGMKPTPVVPEEGRRHFVMATTFHKEAKDVKDYQMAIDEYQKALAEAPWWADAYYNMGVALESAGQFDRATQTFNFYLQANPPAEEVRKVQDHIYAIEAKKVKAAKDDQIARDARRAEEERARRTEDLNRNDNATPARNDRTDLSGVWVQDGSVRYEVRADGNHLALYHKGDLYFTAVLQGRAFSGLTPSGISVTGTISDDNRRIYFKYETQDLQWTLTRQ